MDSTALDTTADQGYKDIVTPDFGHYGVRFNWHLDSTTLVPTLVTQDYSFSS